MAKLATDRWRRESVLGTTYSMELVPNSPRWRTMVILNNPSTLVVRARVNLNLEVYGRSVSCGELYDGTKVWLIFPQQLIRGWFEVEDALEKAGKSIQQMIAECAETNRDTQLTLNLSLEFWDELGERRKLPQRLHYFDFTRNAWIPHIDER